MTFNPKTFYQDLQSAQRWLEKELKYDPSKQHYPPAFRVTTSLSGGKMDMTLSENWMADKHKIEGVDLFDMVEEIKRRIGFQQEQEAKASGMLIEGKAAL